MCKIPKHWMEVLKILCLIPEKIQEKRMKTHSVNSPLPQFPSSKRIKNFAPQG